MLCYTCFTLFLKTFWFKICLFYTRIIRQNIRKLIIYRIYIKIVLNSKLNFCATIIVILFQLSNIVMRYIYIIYTFDAESSSLFSYPFLHDCKSDTIKHFIIRTIFHNSVGCPLNYIKEKDNIAHPHEKWHNTKKKHTLRIIVLIGLTYVHTGARRAS